MPKLGPEAVLNLGFYDPPKSGHGRVPAYFYRDPNGQIPETATLYHEVSHQLLFETAGPNSYTKNSGNFWVFEGLGPILKPSRRRRTGRSKLGGWSALGLPRPISLWWSGAARHHWWNSWASTRRSSVTSCRSIRTTSRRWP